MKIALISGSAGDTRCGVGDYVFELAQHLALDAEVHLYFDQDHAPVEPAYDQLSTLTLHPVGGFSLLTLRSITDELRAGDFDIVHVQYPSKGYGTSLGPGFIPQNLAGMASRSRLAVTLHEWRTSHPLRKMVMDQMLKTADGVLVTNEAELDAVSRRIRRGTQLSAIPVGNVLTSRAELAAVWSPAGAWEPAPIAGFAGRVPNTLFHFGLPAKGKGFTLLLQALCRLRRDLHVPAVLHIGGDFPPGDPLTEELLGAITEFELMDAVVRTGHLPRSSIIPVAEKCMLGVFPFDEGYSSKRSSIAALSMAELPLVVGAGSAEEHPYYAPLAPTAEALADLLAELLSGRAEKQWTAQIQRQREFARRFSFANIAQQHLRFYEGLRKIDT